MQIGERLKGAAAVRETAGLPLKRSSLLVYILGKMKQACMAWCLADAGNSR